MINKLWIIYRAAFKHDKISKDEYEEIKDLYCKLGREKIYEAMKQKKIVPAAAVLFCNMGIDSEFWNDFVNKYRERNKIIVKCIDKIYNQMHQNGVTKLVSVENFGALLSSGQDLAMFGSGDADNYADIQEKNKIYSTFKEMGYTCEEVKAGDLLISSSFRNSNEFPDGFYFSINWDATNRVNLPCFTVKGELIDWDRTRKYNNTEITLPSVEELMYVCLLHIAVHGFCKAPDIRLYYDIANVATSNVDWSIIEKSAKRDGNCIIVSVAALLAHRLLGVEVPDYIINLGKSSQKKKLLDLVYLTENNQLKDYPNRISCFLIDCYSNDRSFFRGMKGVFFPDIKWIQKKYGSEFWGIIKHILSMI